MNSHARAIRASLPEPDGTLLGNLRHTVAVFAEVAAEREVIRATSGIYPAGTPGSFTRGTVTVTGLTHGDLRALLTQLDERPIVL